MHRRFWLSLAMLAVGSGLLVASSLASPGASSGPQASDARRGGTLTFSKSIGITYIDPALAYFHDEWMMQYATCAKLTNYPDANAPVGARLQPEVASGFPRISKNGRTYTWKVRNGFRFHTGQPVTAASFRRAFIRGAHPRMNSPAVSYMHEVVDADAFNNGKAQTISGVVARGNTLTVRLTRPSPDMLARMSMPFFCPLRASDGINPDGINNPPGSGPYYFSSYTPDRRIVLSRNRFYKGKRPANPNSIVVNLSAAALEACRLQTIQGQVDFCVDGIPPNSYAQVAKTYGTNKDNSGRRQPSYFEKALLGFSYVAMNTSRPIFQGNSQLRKAINYAINRPALIAQGGFHSGTPTDQILPPAMPGFTNTSAYPLKMNQAALNRAKQLATPAARRSGNLVLYNGNAGARPLRSAVIKDNLKQIGLDVEVRLMSRATQKERTGRRSEPFDMTDEGWISDYIDPFSFIGALLQGESIQETENVNISYFNVPKYNRAIKAAGSLGGKKRFDAFGKLDVQLSTANDAIPWATYQNFTDRYFISRRVGCFIYNPVFSMDLAALCVK